MQNKTHWENVYQTRATDAVSWFQPHAQLSLDLIGSCSVDRDAPVIDIGGGASTLVDDLLVLGHTDVSVLDISAAALQAAQRRLGARAADVHWLVGDITEAGLPVNHYVVWHDRAVFHFLTEPAQRARYVALLRLSLRQAGHVIIATFANDGPEKCSGLPVRRYSATTLQQEFGEGFTLLEQRREAHRTPGGAVQNFIYCHLQYSG